MIIEIPQEMEAMLEYHAKHEGVSVQAFALQALQKHCTPSYTKGDFNFDLDRIKQSIDSGRIEVPDFDDVEDFLAWVNS